MAVIDEIGELLSENKRAREWFPSAELHYADYVKRLAEKGYVDEPSWDDLDDELRLAWCDFYESYNRFFHPRQRS